MVHHRTAFVLAALLVATASPAAEPRVNLVVNYSFDEGIGLWENIADKTWEQQDDAVDPNSGNPGSLEFVDVTGAGNYVSQCIYVNELLSYEFWAYVKLIPTGNATGIAGFNVLWQSNEFCSHTIEGPGIIHPFGFTGYAPDWTKVHVAGGAPQGTKAALIRLAAQKTGGDPGSMLNVRFDEVFAGRLDETPSTTTTVDITTTTTSDTTSTTLDEPNAPGCADPVPPYDVTTTTDALFVLKGSVGSFDCQDCYCDTDGNGTQTTGDALRTLKRAVGHAVVTKCGGCDE